MAGLAGESIGLGTAEITNIAPDVALADGTDSARGCTTNLIGFGLGMTNQVQTQDSGVQTDFNATDDTVTLAVTDGADYEPTYTDDVLSWEEVIP